MFCLLQGINNYVLINTYWRYIVRIWIFVNLASNMLLLASKKCFITSQGLVGAGMNCRALYMWCILFFCIRMSATVMVMIAWIYNYLCNQCLSPLKLWVIPLMVRCTRCVTTICDKVFQWLTIGRWFSLGTPISSTNNTDCNDITEILLKVVLTP